MDACSDSMRSDFQYCIGNEKVNQVYRLQSNTTENGEGIARLERIPDLVEHNDAQTTLAPERKDAEVTLAPTVHCR